MESQRHLDGCRIDAVEVEHQARKSLTPKDSIVVDLLGIVDGGEDPVLTAFLYLNDHPASTAAASDGEFLLRDTTDEALASEKVVDIKKYIAQSSPKYMIPTASCYQRGCRERPRTRLTERGCIWWDNNSIWRIERSRAPLQDSPER